MREIAAAIVAAYAFLIAWTAAAQRSFPPDIATLIWHEDGLNNKCRSGSGNDPQTWDYCILRDRALEELLAKGWCWGHAGQIEAEKDWERCPRDPLLDVANELMKQSSPDHTPIWRRVNTNDKYIVYFVDIVPGRPWMNGFRDSIVFAADATHTSFSVADLKNYAFDCDGLYYVNHRGVHPSRTSPHSVAAALEAAVCFGDLKPSEYCASFDINTCAEIRNVVQSGERPFYCRPGFAKVERPNSRILTREQTRICSTMGTWH